MGICPDEPRSFFQQQYRWCMGTCTLVLQAKFWQSDISRIHKLCFVNGMFYYIQTALVGGARGQNELLREPVIIKKNINVVLRG